MKKMQRVTMGTFLPYLSAIMLARTEPRNAPPDVIEVMSSSSLKSHVLPRSSLRYTRMAEMMLVSYAKSRLPIPAVIESSQVYLLDFVSSIVSRASVLKFSVANVSICLGASSLSHMLSIGSLSLVKGHSGFHRRESQK
jgi:hypothetical protein